MKGMRDCNILSILVFQHELCLSSPLQGEYCISNHALAGVGPSHKEQSRNQNEKWKGTFAVARAKIELKILIGEVGHFMGSPLT